MGHWVTLWSYLQTPWILRMPRRVEGGLLGKRVVQVSCGAFHTAVITSTGELFTFGQGRFGQLGHGKEKNTVLPRRVEGELVGNHAVQVSCGAQHTAVITSTGELFTFGAGEIGRLGHGGQVIGALVPRRVEALVGTRVVQVACGAAHTAVTTSTGEVYTFGVGNGGQLGHGGHDTELVPRRVEAYNHVIA